MLQRRTTLRSYRTGGLETPHAVRNSLAFDLRDVDLVNQEIIAAELVLPDRIAALCDQARFFVTASEVPYGASNGESMRSLRLNATALADLRAARGAFFSLDAILEDRAGQPLPLSALPADAFSLCVDVATATALAWHVAA